MRSYVATLGVWGPVAVIGLVVLAILVTPIPSAPIALAAGAAYGHTRGTLYVLAGAELGALAAFGIARLVGHELLRHWFGDRLSLGWFGSQNALMGVVFASRLLSFISFDAHFGGEMTTGENDQILLAAARLGLLVAVPLAATALRDYLKRRRPPSPGARDPSPH